MLVAIDEVPDAGVIESHPRPGVAQSGREALREAIFYCRLQHIRVAQDATRQLGVGRVAGPCEVFLERQKGLRKVEPELAGCDVVHSVLVGQMDVIQNLRAVAGAQRVGPERVVGDDPGNRLEDLVTLRVARRLEDVRVVFKPLAEEWTDLETGDPFAEIEGRGRRASEAQTGEREGSHNADALHALPSRVL